MVYRYFAFVTPVALFSPRRETKRKGAKLEKREEEEDLKRSLQDKFERPNLAVARSICFTHKTRRREKVKSRRQRWYLRPWGRSSGFVAIRRPFSC